jgi:protocatechuate 3,4-dioxygenase beta subunit
LAARNGQRSEGASATTDAEGKFEIEHVKPGRYIVSLERAGFVQPNWRGKQVELNSGQDASDLVLHMQASAVIAGKVFDSDGDPIPNISVQAVSARPGDSARASGYAMSNDLGEYRIGGLRPGRYLVFVNPSPEIKVSGTSEKDPAQPTLSYIPTYYPGTIDKTQAVAIELHAGDETPINLTPLTSTTFRIRGVVTKPAGNKFAQLFLGSSSREDLRQGNQPLGDDGAFEFRGLLPGSYTAYLMVVDVAAFVQSRNTRPQMQVMRLGQPIEITNANVDGLHLVPEAPGVVRGRFRMDKEQKIDWTQVSVVLTPDDQGSTTEMLGGGMAGAQVQRDGSFEMKDVTAGNYRVAVTSNFSGLRDYFTKAVNLDGKDVSDSGFSVSGGTSVLDILVSANGATIEGTVVDAKGHPLAEATVVGAPNGERRKRFDLFGQEVSDAQGHFSLHGLNPGEYTVMAWEDPQYNVHDQEFLASSEDMGQKVQLDEGSLKTITVKVIPAIDEEAEAPSRAKP